MRNENKKLQNSIKSCHNQTNDLDRRIDKAQSIAFLSERVMKLEDYARKKSPYKRIVEQAGQTSEQLLEKVTSVVMTTLQLDGNKVLSAFSPRQSSPSQPNQLFINRGNCCQDIILLT